MHSLSPYTESFALYTALTSHFNLCLPPCTHCEGPSSIFWINPSSVVASCSQVPPKPSILQPEQMQLPQPFLTQPVLSAPIILVALH